MRSVTPRPPAPTRSGSRRACHGRRPRVRFRWKPAARPGAVVIEILEGTAAELPAVEALLSQAGLPLDGLRQSERLTVARMDGRIVGAAALEAYKNGVLLRSVVVAEELRNSGLGQRLTLAALAAASRAGSSHSVPSDDDRRRILQPLRVRRDRPCRGSCRREAVSRVHVGVPGERARHASAARAVKARKGGSGRKPGNRQASNPPVTLPLLFSSRPALPALHALLLHSHPIEVAGQSACAVGVEHEADHLVLGRSSARAG